MPTMTLKIEKDRMIENGKYPIERHMQKKIWNNHIKERMRHRMGYTQIVEPNNNKKKKRKYREKKNYEQSFISFRMNLTFLRCCFLMVSLSFSKWKKYLYFSHLFIFLSFFFATDFVLLFSFFLYNFSVCLWLHFNSS